MTPELMIRVARPTEHPQVLELWREARGALGKNDDPEALAALIERDDEALFVAELDGRIVGSLIAAWDGWRGNMYRLTVHPGHRRQRLAHRLVATGEERLRAIGARRISALVWEADRRAARAWLAAGYEHDEGTGRFVKTLVE
jgi:ribosomal protein S18 acetylase RimI-like enzyme